MSFKNDIDVKKAEICVNEEQQVARDDGDAERKLEERIVGYLKNVGLSSFSAKVAFGFLQTQLGKEGGFERMKRVNMFLQAALNGSRAHVSPLQKGCPSVIPGLRALPYWDTSNVEDFPWLPDLEASFQDIRCEFMSLVGTDGLFQPYRSPVEGDASSSFSSPSSLSSPLSHDKTATTTTTAAAAASDTLGRLATSSGDWNVCYLYLHGLNFDANLDKLPVTKAALANVSRFYNHAFLSALVPGTDIIPHYGPTNKKLRCHLPLLVPSADTASSSSSSSSSSPPPTPSPPSCLIVSGEERELMEGKCVIFDDSFEHSSRNSGASPRVVLIFDVWHPDLSPEEIKFMSFLNKGQITAAKKIRAQLEGEQNDFLSVIERSRGASARPEMASAVSHESVWGFHTK